MIRLFAGEIYKLMVWTKAHAIPDVDPRVERKDDLGHRIRFEDYGNRLSPYGWEFGVNPAPANPLEAAPPILQFVPCRTNFACETSLSARPM